MSASALRKAWGAALAAGLLLAAPTAFASSYGGGAYGQQSYQEPARPSPSASPSASTAPSSAPAVPSQTPSVSATPPSGSVSPPPGGVAPHTPSAGPVLLPQERPDSDAPGQERGPVATPSAETRQEAGGEANRPSLGTPLAAAVLLAALFWGVWARRRRR